MWTYTVESVEEGVEQVGCVDLDRFVELVINLVEGNLLGIEEGVASLHQYWTDSIMWD